MALQLDPKIRTAIDTLCAQYPSRLAALLPALHLVQDTHGHITESLAAEVAAVLQVPPTRVWEVATFYTMFYTQPKGRHVVRICRNLACQLRGADGIMAHAKQVLGIEFGETTADGRITLEHEECLASCGTGPMMWCNDELVENLTLESLESYLKALP